MTGEELLCKLDEYVKDGEEINWVDIDWSGIETPVTPTGFITIKTKMKVYMNICIDASRRIF